MKKKYCGEQITKVICLVKRLSKIIVQCYYDYDYEIDLFGHIIKKNTIRYISNRIYTLLNEMSN